MASAEMMIFLFLGVFTINDIHEWNWAFIICTIACCLVFRVIGVLLLVAIANRFRIKKLDWLEQFIMMYGGLRGGVAFALVFRSPPRWPPWRWPRCRSWRRVRRCFRPMR